MELEISVQQLDGLGAIENTGNSSSGVVVTAGVDSGA
jgi:hypothetical protein